MSEKEFTEAEVAKHSTAEDCWLIIGNENTGKLPMVITVTKRMHLVAVVICWSYYIIMKI